MSNVTHQNKKTTACLLTAKKIIFLFAILFAVGLNTSHSQDTWTQKADFGGTARYAAVGFSIGSKGYIGTGYDGSDRKDFWEFDPATNAWTQKADFGGAARYAAVGFSIGSKGYIVTGSNRTETVYYKDFWEYDPATNGWTQKADFGGSDRVLAFGFSIGSKGYLGTGRVGTGGAVDDYKDFWEYDPGTDKWTKKADFAGGARWIVAGFSIGSKGYIGTGSNVDQSIYYRDFWEYDPGTDTWTKKADFPGANPTNEVGFSIGGKGYFGTGQDHGAGTKDFWQYDPATNSWTKKADFGGTARFHAVGFSIGSRGYIGTGAPNTTKDFWEYTPDCLQNITVYADADGDGYGNINKSKINPTCDLAAGYVLDSTDCNDSNAVIHPNAPETFNGIDDNCNGLIDEIAGLSTTNITATTATFHWNALPGTDKYFVRYIRNDSTVETSWKRISVSSPVISITVGGLIPQSRYKWVIRSRRDSLYTDYSGPVKFKTPAALAIHQQNKSYVKTTVKEFVVYPNPTTANVTVNLTLATKQSLFIRVFDVTGKEVYRAGEGMVSGTFSRQIDLSKLSPGTYFLKVIHDGETEVKAIVLKK